MMLYGVIKRMHQYSSNKNILKARLKGRSCDSCSWRCHVKMQDIGEFELYCGQQIFQSEKLYKKVDYEFNRIVVELPTGRVCKSYYHIKDERKRNRQYDFKKKTETSPTWKDMQRL